METMTTVVNTPMGVLQKTFARQAIWRRINNIKSGIEMSAYGESLYGDHVDSPSYDDYLDTNCGDQ